MRLTPELTAASYVLRLVSTDEWSGCERGARQRPLGPSLDLLALVELHTFIFADSERDERPEDAGLVVEGVMRAARELTDPS